MRLYEHNVKEEEENYLSKINPETGEIKEKKRKEIVYDEWMNVDYDWEDIECILGENKDRCKKVSANRSKNMLYYIARSNEWEWFVTLTLDKEKIDRYDFEVVSKKVRKWFDNLRQRKAPDMYYLIVPEQHKDGAWHFHGLIGGCSGLTFEDSGKKDGSGNVIYNFENWKFGYSTATAVQDTERVSSYICKYITKSLVETTEGKQRYWSSKNCKRAVIEHYCLEGVEKAEYKKYLYENMSWKKRIENGYGYVEYFEIPKRNDEADQHA